MGDLQVDNLKVPQYERCKTPSEMYESAPESEDLNEWTVGTNSCQSSPESEWTVDTFSRQSSDTVRMVHPRASAHGNNAPHHTVWISCDTSSSSRLSVESASSDEHRRPLHPPPVTHAPIMGEPQLSTLPETSVLFPAPCLPPSVFTSTSSEEHCLPSHPSKIARLPSAAIIKKIKRPLPIPSESEPSPTLDFDADALQVHLKRLWHQVGEKLFEGNMNSDEILRYKYHLDQLENII